VQTALTIATIRALSESKKEPKWMLEKRLHAFSLWENASLPEWGPSLKELDLNGISYYIDPTVSEKKDWKELPQEIMDTFEKLGIPKAEREFLGGVGAQYDSGVVYHRIQDSLKAQGVIFENMDVAVEKYPELAKEYFMNVCVKPEEHLFVSLHGAVWSGGTFIYVPKGVKVTLPLQAYFRMNAPSSGQFEHTLIIADEGSSVEYIEGCSAPKYASSSLHAGCVELIVKKGATLKYTSIENWSKNTFNLNTKKAIVEANANIIWCNGNIGSHTTMLYPTSVLVGEGAYSESLGVTVAGADQIQDTGTKVIHAAPNTRSLTRSKSIAKDGGLSRYRGFVQFTKNADNCHASTVCDGLLLDSDSSVEAIPCVKKSNGTCELAHEASVGSVSDEMMWYFAMRGFKENDARRSLVKGFMRPLVQALQLEYALELNRLIELEFEEKQV